MEKGSSPLRILHLTTASEAGGLSRYIHDISLALHNLGHQVRVAGARGPWHDMFEQAPFEWIDLPMTGGPIALWQSARRLRKILQEHPADIIHTHYRRATLVARRLQLKRRPPILYTLHLTDMPLGWPIRWRRDFGDYIHVASEDGRRWATEKAGIAASAITLIPHGIDIAHYPVADEAARTAARKQFGLSPEHRVAVYAGRLEEPKNEEWLLDVAQQSAASIPNLRILIAGNGPREHRFRREIARRGLNQRVIALGELKEPLTAYQAADAYLLASLREGFSLACAEAMCVGVPVLRTRTAGTTELIVEGQTGRSVPIRREDFVAGAIEFLKDGDALRAMGVKAARRIREHFQYEHQLAGTIELYHRIAAASRV